MFLLYLSGERYSPNRLLLLYVGRGAPGGTRYNRESGDCLILTFMPKLIEAVSCCVNSVGRVYAYVHISLYGSEH